jgi:hypothetical protein
MAESLVKGVSYLSVWSGSPDPVIAVEDPLQTIVAYEPGSNFRRRAAALKIWRDDWTGNDRANVFLPDGIHKFEAPTVNDAKLGAASQWPGETEAPNAAKQDGDRRRWTELPDEFLRNPVGVVPIVPLRNRPRLLVEGESEIADVTNLQNQINGFLFLLALAGYFGAHRQRWATGIKFMLDDTGREQTIETAIDQLWTNANPDGRFGDFEQTSLDGYIKAIEQKIVHIAVTTRTPKHYLVPEGQEPSGDAIKGAEAGLVKKIKRKMRAFGEGFEEALRLARLFAGAGSTPPDSEIVWADPQIRTEAEITDATIKKHAEGLIDRRQALEDLGYSQTQIERIMTTEPAKPTVPTPGDPVSA